ncbi:MAG: aminotransferase class V-fold PLP-dependent enzyme [Clostridia bacterium]|nr:aminotransferase class V-fold PLP-dependent enzyme [Clostridia bacterium]
MIYFDNAATTGAKPKAVIEAVKNALEHYSANPGRSGHSASIKTAEVVYKTREKLSRFFGSDGPETVVFTQNCTHSANCVIKGLLKRGDHCIISSLEHNAVARPLVKMGVSYSVAEVSMENDDKTVENFKRLIKPNTRLIFCMGASNVWGKILPIEKIGKLCHEKGILFAVDAAQTAGVITIDMKKQHIDFLCVAPHKGLYAPMGIGVLIARKNLPQTIIEGGTGTNSLELYQPSRLPERLESGTLNVPAILGVSAGLDYISKIGIKRLYESELSLITKLYKELKKMPQIILYTPSPTLNSYAPLLSFNLEDLDSSKVANILSQNNIAVRGGLHCSPFAHRQMGTQYIGAIRVSVASFNNATEIDTFLSILQSKTLKK